MDILVVVLPNATVFARPVHPGAFTPSGPRLTQAELLLERAAHDERMRLYTECNAVEEALRTQLIRAVPAVYLQPLRDANTDMIVCGIPDMISYLQISQKIHNLNKQKNLCVHKFVTLL